MEKVQWKNQAVNFVAIVLGVYLAFVVNKCQIDSDIESLQHKYLSSVHADLLRDKTMIENHLNGFEGLRRKTKSLLNYVNGKGGTKDSLDYYLSGIMTQTSFNSYDFAFQSLVSSGRMSDMIDFELVKEMTELYNGKYAEIETLNNLGSKIFQDEVMPRLVYEGAVDDKYLRSQAFINLAMVCDNILSQQIDVYKNAQGHLETCLTALKTKLRTIE